MLVSHEWLLQYCQHDLAPAELAQLLLNVGLKVESMEQVDGDSRLDVEILVSRPDTLGLIGIAREVHAVTGAEFRPPETALEETTTAAAKLTTVEVEDFGLCPQYTARIVTDVKVGPSPEWMQRRLRAVGTAPINNIVDITNYVMMEYSQPLHAFDFEKLNGRKIIVRRARSGEEIMTIDHNSHSLTPEVLVIADAAKAVAIAGVMGGLETEVSANTKTVLLESAQFDRLSIRKTARRLLMDTEASYRFERGVDPEGVELASRRAAQLMCELTGGKVAEGIVWARVPWPEPHPVILRRHKLWDLLGVQVPFDAAAEILDRLGFVIQSRTDASLRVLPPSWRRDVSIEADLIEEVARLYGYDKIPTEGKLSLAIARRSPAEAVRNLAKEIFVGAGYNEAMTVTFVSREAADLVSPWTALPAKEVSNPIRADEPAVRKSLLPSLLAARKTNQDNGNYSCRLFELAAIFVPEDNEELPAEGRALAVLADEDFYALKGTIEIFLSRVGPKASWSFVPEGLPFFKPGRSARILLGKETLGFLGEASSSVCEAFGLRSAPCLCEMDFGKLASAELCVPRYRELNRLPPVTRDLSLVLEDRIRWQEVEESIWQNAPESLSAVSFLSEYRGTQLDPGKKSIAFSLVFQSKDRTLTGEEADSARDEILARLEKLLGATLRQA